MVSSTNNQDKCAPPRRRIAPKGSLSPLARSNVIMTEVELIAGLLHCYVDDHALAWLIYLNPPYHPSDSAYNRPPYRIRERK